MENKKKCFVIMPFSTTKSCTENKWLEIFNYIIKPGVEESKLGYECERSAAGRENIIKSIIDSLNKANVVIADLTDNNPNVFYELGVRHTLANRTILIAQGKKHIPFDLKPYPVAFYSESPVKIALFKKDIKEKLEDIEKNPERSDNPVADFLRLKNIDILDYEKSGNLKKLRALLTEISEDISDNDKIFTLIKDNEQKREKNDKNVSVPNTRFCNSCFELLLSTSYIVLPSRLLQTIQKVNKVIRLTNNAIDVYPNNIEEIEKRLKESLPIMKNSLVNLIHEIAIITNEYEKNNYQEPKTSNILLASPEHEKYLII